MFGKGAMPGCSKCGSPSRRCVDCFWPVHDEEPVGKRHGQGREGFRQKGGGTLGISKGLAG
eukprot:9602840-Lingulodinium_polyedra.AAC.1